MSDLVGLMGAVVDDLSRPKRLLAEHLCAMHAPSASMCCQPEGYERSTYEHADDGACHQAMHALQVFEAVTDTDTFITDFLRFLFGSAKLPAADDTPEPEAIPRGFRPECRPAAGTSGQPPPQAAAQAAAQAASAGTPGAAAETGQAQDALSLIHI